MDNIVLDIQSVKKVIKKKTIIHPLSLQLEKGRVIALCGGNGAGKSTLIRLIIGMITATSGTISINGIKKVNDKQGYANQIGYMPDDFQFQQTITAKETIRFYARLNQVGKKRTNEVLQLVGLTNNQDQTMGTFSKGMKQRMLLAQALLVKPPLLLLDEPTNGLDPHWVQMFSKMMKQSREAGQSVVFSTHDLHVAEEIADEVIFLNDGHVISSGPIHEYTRIGLYETFQQLFLT